MAVIGPNANLSHSDASYYGPSDVCGARGPPPKPRVHRLPSPSARVCVPQRRAPRSVSAVHIERSCIHPCFTDFWNPVDAIAKFAAHTSWAFGIPGCYSTNTSGIAAAAAMGAAADSVVLVVGTDLGWAHEGHDADPVTGLTLPPAQAQLIQEVAAAAKRPVTVVTMTSTPLDLSDVLSNPSVGAVLHVGQPSVA